MPNTLPQIASNSKSNEQSSLSDIHNILPDAGIYFSAVINDAGKTKHNSHDAKDELAGNQLGFSSPTANIYHACGSFTEHTKDNKGRTQDKVQLVRSFWIDVDTAENLSADELAKKDLSRMFATKEEVTKDFTAK